MSSRVPYQRPKITPKTQRALDLLASGGATTIADAAHKAGVTREAVSRQIALARTRDPDTKVAINERATVIFHKSIIVDVNILDKCNKIQQAALDKDQLPGEAVSKEKTTALSRVKTIYNLINPTRGGNNSANGDELSRLLPGALDADSEAIRGE